MNLTMTRSPRSLIAGLVIGAVSVGFAVALTSSGAQAAATDVVACVHKTTGDVRVPSSGNCRKKERKVVWSVQGPVGPRGATGATGATGPEGPSGTTGIFGTGTQTATEGVGAQCTVGEIMLTAGSVAPGLPAEGQLLPIVQNAGLFSLLGTRFGGDGINTFGVPDLADAAPDGLTYSICISGTFPSQS